MGTLEKGNATLVRFKKNTLKFNEAIIWFNLSCTEQRDCPSVLTHNIGKADSCV